MKQIIIINLITFLTIPLFGQNSDANQIFNQAINFTELFECLDKNKHIMIKRQDLFRELAILDNGILSKNQQVDKKIIFLSEKNIGVEYEYIFTQMKIKDNWGFVQFKYFPIFIFRDNHKVASPHLFFEISLTYKKISENWILEQSKIIPPLFDMTNKYDRYLKRKMVSCIF